MKRTGGQLLLISLLLLILIVNISRVSFQQEADTAFLSKNPDMVQVQLGNGFPEQSIHQYIDGSRWHNVIKMTGRQISSALKAPERLQRPVKTGEKIDLVLQGGLVAGFNLSWMPAAKRVALGIPLHPDRMTEADWQVLPGIGAQTAQMIERDRQKNGDFGSVATLSRVPGLGKKRLSAWNQYFFTEKTSM